MTGHADRPAFQRAASRGVDYARRALPAVNRKSRLRRRISVTTTCDWLLVAQSGRSCARLLQLAVDHQIEHG
jgi:hypothetical protein